MSNRVWNRLNTILSNRSQSKQILPLCFWWIKDFLIISTCNNNLNLLKPKTFTHRKSFICDLLIINRLKLKTYFEELGLGVIPSQLESLQSARWLWLSRRELRAYYKFVHVQELTKSQLKGTVSEGQNWLVSVRCLHQAGVDLVEKMCRHHIERDYMI